MSKVDEAIVELQNALDSLAPELEGLEDDERLNIKEDTRISVVAFKGFYIERKDFITTALNALKNLVNDDYPNVPVRAIPDSQLADLDDQIATLQAARAKFVSDGTQAANLNLEAGPEVPQ